MSDSCQKRRRSDIRMALVKEKPEGPWVARAVEADQLPRGEEYGSIVAHIVQLLEPALDFIEKADRATTHARFSNILHHARILMGEVHTTRDWAENLRRKEKI